MGRNPEADREKRERARAALLDAALALFAENGFAGTTMAALARRAGVSKGLAYHYVPSKQDLVDAVVARRVAEVAQVAAGVPADLPAPERLRLLAHAMVREVDRDPDGYRLYLRALASPDTQRAAASAAARVDRADFVRLFADLGASDPEVEARFFQVALLGIVAHRVLSPVAVPAAPLVDRLLEAVLDTP